MGSHNGFKHTNYGTLWETDIAGEGAIVADVVVAITDGAGIDEWHEANLSTVRRGILKLNI